MERTALTIALVCVSFPVHAKADPFAKARACITKYCAAQTRQPLAACIAEQKHGLGRFVTIMAGFDDPGQKVARTCMIRGKSGSFVNWVAAKRCMQSAANGIPLGRKLKLP